MLRAIRDIGRKVREEAGKSEIETLVQEPLKNPLKNPGVMVFIKIDPATNSYCGVDLEDYDTKKKMLYLYRRGSSSGPNATPGAAITELPKTFERKIANWFNEEQDPLLLAIKRVLEEKREEILEEIQSKLKDIDRKKGRFLSLKLKQGEAWRYLGEMEIFKTALLKNARAATERREAVADNHICSICGNTGKVTGDPGVFKFSTIDKPGFIAGGFDPRGAWRNFPVCYQCKLDLEEGRKFIEEKLKYKFYGLNYYLIPRLLLGEVTQSEIFDVLVKGGHKQDLEEKRQITDDENEILDYLSQQPDVLTVNLLFLQKEQSAERILLLIEDVFPSRLRSIFEAKERVDELFKADFTLGKIRTFFKRSSAGGNKDDLNKYFLEIVDRVFNPRPLALSFLMKFLTAGVRQEFLKESEKGYFSPRVKDGLMALLFLNRLGVIKFEEAKHMTSSNFDALFEKYPGLLGSPAKRGVFLLGALTQMLLKKQYGERGATPFRKNLKGLRMNEGDIRALLPRVCNKLEEYGAFDSGKKEIARAASRYLLEAGADWKIPVDELNFIFACGMSLEEDVKGIVYPEKEESL